MPATTQVKISLSTFVDYVNVTGPKRSNIMDQQIERQQNPEKPAWWPYAAAERGCLAALAADDSRPALDRMVADAPLRMESHYGELRDGLTAFIRKEKPLRTVATVVATWTAGDLLIKVNHTVGLELPDGRLIVALLYFKSPKLGAGGTRPALHILGAKSASILPDSQPAILDVRRGKLAFMPTNVRLDKLDSLLVGETAGYLAHWLAAAA